MSLTLSGQGWKAPPLSADAEALKESQALLAKFVAAEAVKRELAKARNDLESYIIDMKEKLETDELIIKVGRVCDACSVLVSRGVWAV